MIVNFDKEHSQNLKIKKNKRKGKFIKSMLIILFFIGVFFILILKSGYFGVIYDVYKITGHTVARKNNTTTTNYNKYKYANKFTNILILGSDTDQKFNPQSILTQTIMIASINPYQKKVYLISIPRDFWIKIPNYYQNGGYSKFDTASEIGGISLTRSLVEKYFGIKIDYYAWVGLKGFIKVVNTFGGVNIVPTHPVLDWSYPNDLTGNPNLLYSAINLYIPGSPQYMNGFRTLEYVRSRHGDLMGDFGRAKRQQQVLRIIEKKMHTQSTISQIPSLFNQLSNVIRTDMNIPQIIGLAQEGLGIHSSSIKSIVLSPPNYSTIALAYGQDIVEPRWNKINQLFTKLYGE